MKTLFSVCLSLVVSSAACSGVIADPPHVAAKTQSQAGKITAIRLWNNLPSEKILLKSDGTASYFGGDLNSRPGVGEYHGTFSPNEFHRLAEAFNRKEFADLREQYPVHYAVGTALYSIAVVTNDQPEKLILVGSGRVPDVLGRLKSAIHEAASKVVWHEGPSGVRGVLVMQNAEPLPDNATVDVQSLDRLFGSSDIAFPVDGQGRFEMPLPPGSYQLTPHLKVPVQPGYWLFWNSSRVTVVPNKYTPFRILCTARLMPLVSYRR